MSSMESTTTAPSTALQVSDPIFIVGCPRSGTTLLSAIFDRHSQVAATPETFFFRHFWKHILGGREQYPAQQLVKLLTEGRYTRDLQLDPAVLAKHVGNREMPVMEFFKIALALFAQSKGKIYCAEKTPPHLFYVPDIVKHFPSSRIVCIYRDGRDCALSLRKLYYAIPALRSYTARWRESSVAMLEFQKRYPDRFTTVQYEALITEPVVEMTKLMKFTGLEFEAGQLDASRPTGVVVDWDYQIKKNVLSDIDPSRAYAWKRTATPRQLRIMNSMMRPYLGLLGYEPGDEGLGSLPVRTYDAAMNGIFRFAFSNRFAEWRRIARSALRPVFGNSPHVMPLAPVRESESRQNGPAYVPEQRG